MVSYMDGSGGRGVSGGEDLAGVYYQWGREMGLMVI
jgi:hypothetical protein